MYIIVDEDGRVIEHGDGCLIDDRIEVPQPEGWQERYSHNWVLQDRELIHAPLEEEVDYKEHILRLEKLLLKGGIN